MSLRILIGHSQLGQRGTASLLYLGSSGGELETVKANAPATVGSFSIINNPTAIRKGHHKYDPNAKAAAEAIAVKTEIPTDLKGLKKDEIASAAAAAIARVKELEAIVAELRKAKEPAQQQAQTEADSTGSDETTTQAS